MEVSNYLKLQQQVTELLKKTKNFTSLKENFESYKEPEKKLALEQAFRELIIKDYINDLPQMKDLLKLSIETCKGDLCTSTLPVILLADLFEVLTLDKCEELFTFVEENVSVFKEELFFTNCKNHLLRMSNDLLRKLSRSQNTVFCGRILLFLAKFFPFSERSGVNIVSEFNVENITEYDTENAELSDALGQSDENIFDYNFYCKFWSIQGFFRTPNICYDKANWKKFTAHTEVILSAFSSFKLEQNETKSSAPKSKDEMEMDSSMNTDNEVEESQHYFAKFLTNPKLLALQLSDSNFRRTILVQYLILFHYLNSTVKFKTEAETLSAAQTEWIVEREAQIYKLLEETHPNGDKIGVAIKHMLKREELWNNWKNDGCKEITRPDPNYKDAQPPPPKRGKRGLGDLIRDSNKQGKFYMGTPELTKLWNLCPDNLQACKGTDRNFLPALDAYLESPKAKSDPSFEWRALRLLARQSPHFFSLANTASCKISDLLELVHKRIMKDKNEHKPELEENVTTDQLESEPIEEEMDDTEQLTPEEENTHKTTTATPEQILEISKEIGKDWKKLGSKLGYSKDEIEFYESESTEVSEQCKKMLTIWFEEDDDANLDNLAYTLEGLEILKAAELIKEIIGADKVEEIVE